MKREIFASTSAEESARERAHRALARRMAAEGMVLLKNNGALPLSGGRAALYGAGVRHTSFGGTGSGDTHPRRRVTAEEGFLAGGWTVCTGLWLDDYDERMAAARGRWQREVAGLIRGVPLTRQSEVAWQHPFVPPEGREIAAEDAAEGVGTAVYVLMRQAGESADRAPEGGSYYISGAELGHLRALKALYPKVVLVINSGAPIDMGFDDELGLDAVLYASQGGMEMGSALFDVLTGLSEPGGRLTDSWAERLADFPPRFGGEREVEYREGIYMGYRWFDSFGIEPRWPFGFGLGYTTFAIECLGAEAAGTEVRVRAHVTNTGARAGREVAQLYLSAPGGALRREYQSLAAFAKTPPLAPGEGCGLTLAFDLREHAAYDEGRSAFVLEPGDYLLRLGRDSRSTSVAACVHLDGEAVTERCQRLCAPRCPLEELAPPERAPGSPPPGVPRLDIAAGGIAALTHDYSEPPLYRSARVDAAAAQLSDLELAELITGSTYTPPFHATVFGSCGRTSAILLKKGARDLIMADGPQGLNLKRASQLEPYTLPAIPHALDGSRAVRLLRGVLGALSSRKTYYQFTTAWPCASCVAQSWDISLAEEQGRAVSAEMEEYGVDFYLAPAMNLHRQVLCGRNFEYFSEDPLLSGEMAAAVCRGVQSRPGRYAVIKHFACNNTETERTRSDSRLGERALRELYLKGFRIAIRRGGAKALMSSYNLINGVYAPNDRELLTGILRCEWGFEGLVMTDWFATGHDGSRHELCCMAGNDLVMPGTPAAVWDICRALRSGRISRLAAEAAARRVLRFAFGEI